MADAAALVEIVGRESVSGPAGVAVGALSAVEAAAGKTGSAFASLASTVVKTAAAVATLSATGIIAGLTAATTAAAGFEKQMSAVGAVSGASAQQLKDLSALALKLGADTSFSASQSAQGIEELVKAGVSIADVMGGAAKASLDLAAAGGVDVATAAEIASNAMNVFNIKGKDMAHVADEIAGAANASAIDVNDYKFSLAAAGAVAATVGINFDDLSTAIAVMGQAGIKGSDAGTSLKTMLLNLTPSTKAQIAEAKELGIVTADGANKFFDASGKAKSMAEIAQVLQTATKGLTEQQRLQALQTLFGTDAIRAAAIMARAGAGGFNEMAAAIGKVSAADVANTRLDNLAGSIEKFKGSAETAAITVGQHLTPPLRRLVDIATDLVNKSLPDLDRFGTVLGTTFDRLIDRAQHLVPHLGAVRDILDGIGGRAGQGLEAARQGISHLVTEFEKLVEVVRPTVATLLDMGRTAGPMVQRFAEMALPALKMVGQYVADYVINQVQFLTTYVLPAFYDVAVQTFGFFRDVGPTLAHIAGVLREQLGVTLIWLADEAWPNLLSIVRQTVEWFNTTLLPLIPSIADALRVGLGEALYWLATTGWPALLSAATTAITWIQSTGIPAVMSLVDWIGPKLSAVLTWVTQTGWPALMAAGSVVSDWVTGTAAPALSSLWDWLSPKLSAALGWLTDTGWPTFVTAATAVSDWITQTAIPALTPLVEWLNEKLGTAVAWLIETGWPTFVTTATSVSDWMTQTAVPALSSLWSWLEEKTRPAVQWFIDTGWPELERLGRIAVNMWSDMVAWTEKLWDRLRESGVITSVTTSLGLLWDTGKILVETFWPGMTSGAGDAFTAIDPLVTLLKGAAGFLRAFAEGVHAIAEGFKFMHDNPPPDWFLNILRGMPGGSLVAGALQGGAGSGAAAPPAQAQSPVQAVNAGPIDNSSRAAFAATAYPYALRAAGGNPDLANYLIASGISEANAGSGKDLAAVGFNFGGIKYDPMASGSGSRATWEQEHGQRVDQNATFSDYAGPQEGFDAIPRFIQTNFPQAWARYQQTKNVKQLYADINAGGYASDTSWHSTIDSIATQQVAPVTAGISVMSGRASGPVGAGLENFQQTQQQWARMAADADAICGPYLASLFADAVGRPPTADEARTLAERMGIYSGSGAGSGILSAAGFADYATALIQQANPGSAASVHQQMGVSDAQATSIAADSLAGGAGLAGFNTLHHYFGADAYDSNSGKFHVGGTGLSLAGGAEWMSVDEMTSKMGPLLGVLTLADSAAGAASVALHGVGDSAAESAPLVSSFADDTRQRFQILAADSQVDISEMADGLVTQITDAAGNVTSTVTDMNGNVVRQFASMADGTLIATGNMGTSLVESLDQTSGLIDTTMTDAAGNVVETVTDMTGKVLLQTATMADSAGASFGAVGTAATNVVAPLDAFSQTIGNLPTPNLQPTADQFGIAEQAAKDAQKAAEEYASYLSDIDNFDWDAETNSKKPREYTPASSDNHRAGGGPVWPGTWLVGEEGPELLTLGSGQYGGISNNRDTRRALGSGNDGGIDHDALAKAIARELMAVLPKRGDVNVYGAGTDEVVQKVIRHLRREDSLTGVRR